MDNEITVKSESLDIVQTLECGQVFRFYKENDGYFVTSKDQRAFLEKVGDNIVIKCTDKDYFLSYFDLNTDYSKIKNRLKDKPLMDKAIKFGSGIRILRQDLFETVISFIISANNHIPRIKGIIERLCVSLGEKKEGYFAFPTPEKMASANLSFYESIGAGYRADYLYNTARMIAEGFNLEKVYEMETFDAVKYLCKLKGVGEKVANCILLFGAGKMDTFPVDTWIKKVYADIFGENVNSGEMCRKLIELYGKDSGYAQQYLFYYKREKEDENSGDVS